MTHSEAYRQMFGSVSNMKAVLQQRRAIAEEAIATAERLQKKLCERFPPVDSVGANLNLTFESDVWTLRARLKEIDAAIADCGPRAVTEQDPAKRTPTDRPRTRRRP